MRKASMLLFLYFLMFEASAQKTSGLKEKDLQAIEAAEDSIAILARLVVEDSVVYVRTSANMRLEILLKKALSRPGSFNYAFEKVENISIVNSPDKSFRIFTWQLFIDSAHYQYKGFIQTNASKNALFALNDVGKTLQNPEKQFLVPEKWYGCLYYNIKPFKSKNGTEYLLFGYNSNDWIEKIKICDVLTFRNGRPVFGAPVFATGEKGNTKTVNRLIVKYGAESTDRLNYDEQEGFIITDHLEAVKSPNPQVVPYVLVPDGTYEAYKLQNGEWRHVDMLPTTPMDQAPRPMPLSDKRGKISKNKEDVRNFDWPDEVKKKQ